MSATRLYRRLLALMPPHVAQEERDEIARTFELLYGEADTGLRRARLLSISFGRLPSVLFLEWRDHVRATRAMRRRDKPSSAWGAVLHGARSVWRAPLFAVSAVLLLGLGIGAVTTIFSIVDHVVLRPLPYPAAERLVVIHVGQTFPRLEAMRTVERWGVVFTGDAILTGGDEPLRLKEATVSRDFFSLFGGRPAVGRLFVADDFDGADPVVLSYDLWRRAWAEDPSIVGRTIRLDGKPRIVIGVLEGSFVPPGVLYSTADVYTALDRTRDWFSSDNAMLLQVAGLLSPGATVEQAQAEADRIAAERAEEFPRKYVRRDGSVHELPVRSLQEATVAPVRRGLGLIFGAVTLLLLVACVNVAHLFMARGVERTREMAVRRALGAATPVLARQLAVESALVGLAGALVGAGMAVAGIGAFRALAPEALPWMDAIAVDLRVLAFAIAVGLATALLFGLLPALRLAVRGRESPLRMAARGSTASSRTHAARHALVAFEVGLSLVLTVQAAWLIRSFVDLHSTDLGFRTEGVWTVPLLSRNVESPADWYRRMEAVRESLAEVPGVQAATFGLTAPLEEVGGDRCCWFARPAFEGEDPEGTLDRTAMVHPVDADYFSLFELGLLAGRAWDRSEQRAFAAPSPPRMPTVISEPLAIEVFGAAAAAVGRPVWIRGREYVITGVVGDNRHYGPDQEHGHALYVPAPLAPFPHAHMVVLVDGSIPELPRRLAEAVWRVEPDLPVPTVRSMEEWASRATTRARLLSGLFSAFGAVALLLVAGGLAGTLLYVVRTRRRELGIRLALGATPAVLERSVLRRGVLLALAGVVVGGAGTWGSGRLMEALSTDLDARDPTTFAAAVAVLMTVTLLASWLPARRAAQTDPIEALRVE